MRSILAYEKACWKEARLQANRFRRKHAGPEYGVTASGLIGAIVAGAMTQNFGFAVLIAVSSSMAALIAWIGGIYLVAAIRAPSQLRRRDISAVSDALDKLCPPKATRDTIRKLRGTKAVIFGHTFDGVWMLRALAEGNGGSFIDLINRAERDAGVQFSVLDFVAKVSRAGQLKSVFTKAVELGCVERESRPHPDTAEHEVDWFFLTPFGSRALMFGGISPEVWDVGEGLAASL